MAQRPYLMPSRFVLIPCWASCTLFVVSSGHRYREVHQVASLCSRRCKAAHRCGESHDRPFAASPAWIGYPTPALTVPSAINGAKSADMLEPVPVADGGVADPSRRHFRFRAACWGAGAARKGAGKEGWVDGGLRGHSPTRKCPIERRPLCRLERGCATWPQHCTGFSVSACRSAPNGVLRPSTRIGNADANPKVPTNGATKSTGNARNTGGASARRDSRKITRPRAVGPSGDRATCGAR